MYYLILFLLMTTFIFNVWLQVLNYKHRNQPIPEEVKDVYDLKTYQKWLNYNMENFRLSLVSKIFNFIFSLCLLIFGFFPSLFQWITTFTNHIYLQTLVFLGIYFLIEFVLDLFFSYYCQFHIEDKYGFNKSTMKTFIVDQIKGLLLSIILGGAFIYLITLLYFNVGNFFYFYSWIFILMISLLINFLYVKLFVPIFNKLTPLEDGPLKDKIIEFANKVGYEINKISVIDSSRRSTKLNAFFSGFGKTKQVVLYDTLLNKMNDEQVISVLAHEIGHSKHQHILKNMLISLVSISIYLLVFVFSVKSRELSVAFGFTDVNFGFGLLMFSILISPISIILELITSHLSRRFEYQADHFASTNGYQKEMEESLKILARENFSNLTPHPLYVALRYSHPTINDRIKRIRNHL